ncbi:MAG: transglycosylase SLT domain-containing protein [Burkholderiales bacterium]
MAEKGDGVQATGHVIAFGALAALLCGACAQLPQAEPEEAAKTGRVPAQEEAVKAERAPAQVVTTLDERIKEAAATTPPPAATAAEAIPVAPPPLSRNIWYRVRAGFSLPPIDGKLVARQEQWYVSNPDYVARMAERSGHFLYHVLEEVERRKMPTEIALLPMVESAYNPTAYSRSHAAGMWQFIPSTGKIYGLRQNFWYDGRRDVLAATNAALDYLQKLYDQFDDWTLALAAYNWGEGAVSRAMARNRAKGLPTSYESLAMPLETRNYVPKLQAVKNIVANPGQYGIVLPDIPNRPYFATVTTSRHIDVKLAAALAEMELEDFRFLNPAHNKPVIKADGSETIVLPIDRIEAFQRNLKGYDQPFVTWQTYTMKRHDEPAAIAKKHGITLAELKEANGISGKKKFVPGQTLLVPLKSDVEPNLPDLPAPKITQARYRRAAACYVVTNAGVKKRVQCAPSKKKTQQAAANTAPKHRASSSSPPSGASIRALTGG